VAGRTRVRGPRVASLAGDPSGPLVVAIISAGDRLGGDVSSGRARRAHACDALVDRLRTVRHRRPAKPDRPLGRGPRGPFAGQHAV
jgi:hypothetical protein